MKSLGKRQLLCPPTNWSNQSTDYPNSCTCTLREWRRLRERGRKGKGRSGRGDLRRCCMALDRQNTDEEDCSIGPRCQMSINKETGNKYMLNRYTKVEWGQSHGILAVLDYQLGSTSDVTCTWAERARLEESKHEHSGSVVGE